MAEDAMSRLGAAQLDAVLEFLPIFETPGFQFGALEAPEGQGLYYAFSVDTARFMQTLYTQNVVVSFDWTEWQETAKDYINDPSTLDTADLLTLRKLLTTHVRKDRFVEGHLAGMLESGQITAILQRLRQIRRDMS